MKLHEAIGLELEREELRKRIAPCPCGKVPSKLHITGEHSRAKWAEVCGDCCGEWSIEFRNQYHELGGLESERLALSAWNAAPRSKQHCWRASRHGR